jgi:hypothetical protein
MHCNRGVVNRGATGSHSHSLLASAFLEGNGHDGTAILFDNSCCDLNPRQYCHVDVKRTETVAVVVTRSRSLHPPTPLRANNCKQVYGVRYSIVRSKRRLSDRRG